MWFFKNKQDRRQYKIEFKISKDDGSKQITLYSYDGYGAAYGIYRCRVRCANTRGGARMKGDNKVYIDSEGGHIMRVEAGKGTESTQVGFHGMMHNTDALEGWD